MAAKPDLDDGWLKYAHELDTALAAADLTKGARIVLREVFAQVFGPAKRIAATLSPSAIAGDYGVCRQYVSRAIKELVDSNILARSQDGAFRFVKDYESWLRNGTPRLTVREIESCRKAPSRAMAWKHLGETESLPNGGNPVSPPATGLMTNGGNPDDKTATESFTPIAAPYRNAGAELETGEKRQSTQESVAVLKFDPPKEESCPEYPHGDGGMWDIFPGQHPMPEGKAHQLFSAIWGCWKNQRLCFEFYQRQSRFTYEVWRAAFAKAKTQGTTVQSLTYIERIAADYQANGIPKPKPIQAGSRPSSPASLPIKPLHPPGTVLPSKYLNPPPRIGSA